MAVKHPGCLFLDIELDILFLEKKIPKFVECVRVSVFQEGMDRTVRPVMT